MHTRIGFGVPYLNRNDFIPDEMQEFIHAFG